MLHNAVANVTSLLPRNSYVLTIVVITLNCTHPHFLIVLINKPIQTSFYTQNGCTRLKNVKEFKEQEYGIRSTKRTLVTSCNSALWPVLVLSTTAVLKITASPCFFPNTIELCISRITSTCRQEHKSHSNISWLGCDSRSDQFYIHNGYKWCS